MCIEKGGQHTVGSRTVQSLIKWRLMRLLRKHWKSYNSVKGNDDQRRLADKGLFIRRSLYWGVDIIWHEQRDTVFVVDVGAGISLATLCKVSLVLDNCCDQWQAVWLREDRSPLMVVVASKRRRRRRKKKILHPVLSHITAQSSTGCCSLSCWLRLVS